LRSFLADYFGGVVELGVVVESDFGGVVLVVDPEVLDLDSEELDPDPVELLEAVLEALAGAVGVVPVGVDNIGTKG
jgi:hypothetical protein